MLQKPSEITRHEKVGNRMNQSSETLSEPPTSVGEGRRQSSPTNVGGSPIPCSLSRTSGIDRPINRTYLIRLSSIPRTSRRIRPAATRLPLLDDCGPCPRPFLPHPPVH